MSILERAFARNRAEEMGLDMWSDFVVPLYFDRLQVMYVRKPYVIVGGRGCGKTTLLRYWSYNTQFSSKRGGSVPLDAFETIGLYIRTDIQFLSSFKGSGLDMDTWSKAFEHALCLAVADEILGCLAQINCNAARVAAYGELESLDFSILSAFHTDIPATYNEFRRHVTTSRFKLATWVNNIDGDAKPPTFLPLRSFVSALIQIVQSTLPYLAKTVFAVFVDEYESFLPYQQIFVNTLMKLSEPPLVFHVAMKRNGMSTRQTTGPEMIQEKADFRTIDIEKEQADDFDLFAAELFFFRLMLQDVHLNDNPVDIDVLTSPARITERRNDKGYRQRLKLAISEVLPGVSQREVAAVVLGDKPLRDRYVDTLKKGLARHRSHGLTPEDFIDPEYPEASVVCAALLHQRKTAREVHEEFEKLKSGLSSKFISSSWIQHFLFGTLLYMYLPLPRPCELFSGFETFIALSQGNTRHFLELCHLAIARSGRANLRGNIELKLVVKASDQAEAARETSARFLEEIKGSGNLGNQLYHVATTLGQIFKLAQQRPSQSEPERTHFAVSDGQVSESAQRILVEAEKWGVLIAQDETKVKNPRYTGKEYKLNPIYAPSYGISYRAGRKLDLSVSAADRLLLVSTELSTQIIREFERAWNVDNGNQLSLIGNEGEA
ncbi:ORC-CDC6 family AAA ATPase [Paraburkholderia sediminicola]|uniref:ORC-CDC6 family AAA ATPase n=1 Tax=Paraburkholderia sediminicola TaxID=458836 RepID=UPI0038BD7929